MKKNTLKWICFGILILGTGLRGCTSPGRYSATGLGGLAERVLNLQSGNEDEAANSLYLLAHRPDGLDSLVIMDLQSGFMESIYDGTPGSIMTFAPDQQSVYIYEEGWPTSPGRLVRVDIKDSTVVVEINVPQFPWVGPPGQGLWLSRDVQHIYLQVADQELEPSVYTIDVPVNEIENVFNLKLPYPANQVGNSPLAWKLPWVEKLVVVCGDRLFPMDLETGDLGESTKLFNTEGIAQVPMNWSRGLYVRDGDLDPLNHRLYLATSTQEILSVDLTKDPFQVNPVFSLPTGWQFAGMSPLLVDSGGGNVYIQVKRNDSPIIEGIEVDEVWRLDTSRWNMLAKVQLGGHGPFREYHTPASSPSDSLYPQSYGLALSPDGKEVLILTQLGLLFFENKTNRKSIDRFVDTEWGDIPKPFWYAPVE